MYSMLPSDKLRMIESRVHRGDMQRNCACCLLVSYSVNPHFIWRLLGLQVNQRIPLTPYSLIPGGQAIEIGERVRLTTHKRHIDSFTKSAH